MQISLAKKDQMNDQVVYFLKGVMYLNITNGCTNDCTFCLRENVPGVGGIDLWWNDGNRDPNAQLVIHQIEAHLHSEVKEIVFCGYGEPTLKLKVMCDVAQYIREVYPSIVIRANSNGHANIIHKRNTAPDLAKALHAIHISLNAENLENYTKYNKPLFDPSIAFLGTLDFIECCVKAGLDTTVTAVDGGDVQVDLKAVEQLALERGAKFRARPWLESGHDNNAS